MKKIDTFKSLIIIASLAMLLFQCQKNPIPYDLSDSILKVDTISVSNIKGSTYLSPPLIGDTEAIYFGNKDGFVNKYSLLKYSPISASEAFWTYDLPDTNLTVDSLIFAFSAMDTIIPTDAKFELFYFPAGGDSVFSEDESNYLNFTDAEAESGVSIGQTSFIIDKSDSAQSEYPQLRFKVDERVMVDDLVTFISDTNDVENRSFLLKNIDTIEDSIISIRSRESQDYPIMLVYYTIEDNQFYSVFFPLQDVTIVEPRPISDIDKTHISVCRAAGLKALIHLDLSQVPQDSNTMVIKDAELFFNSTSVDSLDDFQIRSTVLVESVGILSYHEVPLDEYEIENDIYMTGNFEYNQMEMELRQFIQGLMTGSYKNYGLKLYSPDYNDPFKTVNLIIDSDVPNQNPMIKITYVTL